MESSKEQKMEKKIDVLSRVVQQQSKVIDALGNCVKAETEKTNVAHRGLIEILEAMAGKLDMIHSTMELIGKKRLQNCVYSRNGYCENIKNAISDPLKSEENTVKIGDIYYPQINWTNCYCCPNYEVPPEISPSG